MHGAPPAPWSRMFVINVPLWESMVGPVSCLRPHTYTPLMSLEMSHFETQASLSLFPFLPPPHTPPPLLVFSSVSSLNSFSLSWDFTGKKRFCNVSIHNWSIYVHCTGCQWEYFFHIGFCISTSNINIGNFCSDCFTLPLITRDSWML